MTCTRFSTSLLEGGEDPLLPQHTSLPDLLSQFSVYFSSKIVTIRAQLDSVAPTSDVTATIEPMRLAALTEFQPVSSGAGHKACLRRHLHNLQPGPYANQAGEGAPGSSGTTLLQRSSTGHSWQGLFLHQWRWPWLNHSSRNQIWIQTYWRTIDQYLTFHSYPSSLKKLLLHSFRITWSLATYRNGCSRPIAPHSVETAFLCIQNDILHAMDNQHGVLIILLDLSAAFDTLDHDILLSRLESRIGISGFVLRWFSSYLSDRYQSVNITGQSSDLAHLKSGVPQGLCWGLCYSWSTFLW